MTTTLSTETLYVEVQQFRQIWIWALIIPISLLVVGLFGYAIITQLLLGKPWGSKPMPDILLLFMGPIIIFLNIGLPLFIYAIKMVTRIDRTGIHLHFFPLKKEHIPFTSILEVEAREYRPLTEYGGWGVRNSAKGRAFNVAGNQGVQVTLKNGDRLLIGSQKAEDLANVIKAHLS